MAGIEIKNPNKTANTGAYSDGILVDGWLYVSGQGPIDVATGATVSDMIEEETRLTLRNMDDVLRAEGCTYADVVRCTCHRAHIEDFERFNRAYSEFFTGMRPTRTTAQSVLGQGIQMEIDAIAKVPTSARTEQ